MDVVCAACDKPLPLCPKANYSWYCTECIVIAYGSKHCFSTGTGTGGYPFYDVPNDLKPLLCPQCGKRHP